MSTKTKAYAYLRVSSQGQVDGHGFDRQRQTIRAYARKAGYEITDEYQDAHTGTSADRPGFANMLADLISNGVKVVIVESLDRFARDVLVQGMLLARMKDRGLTLISAATGEDVTAAMAGDPMREAMVLMQSVFAQTEKKLLVRKLAKARQAKRESAGQCEGRKPYGTRPGEPEVVDQIRALRRKRPQHTGRAMSYQAIAKALNNSNVPTRYGQPWAAATVQNIVKRSCRKQAS